MARQRALGGAWPGAERTAQAARAGDPAPGPEPRSGGERRGPGAAQARGHGRLAVLVAPTAMDALGDLIEMTRSLAVGRSRARADRGRGRRGGRATGRHGRARTAQGGAPGARHHREDGRVLVAFPRCGHHSARRAGGRRPACDRLPGRGARPETVSGARARAVRRRPAGGGGRIRTRGAGGRALRRRRPRLGGACARGVGRARQGRSAAADRHGLRRRGGARREPPARRRVAHRAAHRRNRRRAPARRPRAATGSSSSPKAPAYWWSGCPTAGATRDSGACEASWRRQPPAPTVFVRRGARPGGLAPAETRTRFRWSLTAATRG